MGRMVLMGRNTRENINVLDRGRLVLHAGLNTLDKRVVGRHAAAPA
jgi:hypothetical protein